MRVEVACLDLADGGPHQPAKFLPLLLGDRCLQVLNLGRMLPNKDHQRYLRNAADPGVADKLRIERKQTLRAVGITTGGGFPVDQATNTVYLTYGIEIRNK